MKGGEKIVTNKMLRIMFYDPKKGWVVDTLEADPQEQPEESASTEDETDDEDGTDARCKRAYF